MSGAKPKLMHCLFACSIVILLLGISITTDDTILHEGNPEGNVTIVDHNVDTSVRTRYANEIIEDFDNYTGIDLSNTTSIVNTYSGKAHISGWGSNPQSNIRDVSTPDRSRHYNRFTGRCVAQDQKFYIRDRYSTNKINVYASLNSFMANGNQIDSFNLPFNPTNYGQMIYANGHLYFSNSGTVDKLRLSDRTKQTCSLSGSGATGWNWGGNSQCGLTTDGEYIYTFSNNLLRIYNMQEALLRQVTLPEAQRGLSTCFSAGHYFYPVDYSWGNMVRRVNGGTGGIENYNDVAMQGKDYLTCFNYDYYGNTLIMTNGNAGNNPDTTWTIDNLCFNFGGTGQYDPLSYVQSTPLYTEWPTIGVAKMTWYESKPQGTNIVYNLTIDGERWVTMQNNTPHIFDQPGSRLLWNATLTTNSKDATPYIDKIVIEYDLIGHPETSAPSSDVWQSTTTPMLEWNFTDPDKGDHQSDYLVEIYNGTNMEHIVYNSSWVNSTDSEHVIRDELDDGIYYWRVKTKDAYHAASNFSALKMFKIDVTKPKGSIVIQEGVMSINDQLVDLAINASDNGSGVADMQIIGDKGNEMPWEEYGPEKRIVISASDGWKTVGVRFKDHAGIVSDVFNDSVYFDGLGPGTIVISSPTHPDQSLYYNSSLPVFQWEPPQEVTEIKGYSYTVDNSQLTEPPKLLYNQNGDITSTSQGEFSGLLDGTWYFHITSCDIYDQWGNTSHYRFNIDTTVPVLSDLVPEDRVWINATTIRTETIFEDIDGFGLDLDSIMYSVKLHQGSYSAWTDENVEIEVLEIGISDNPRKVRAWVDIELVEGDGNAVKWRVTDISGNGPYVTESRRIMVDLSLPTFDEFVPDPEEEEIFLVTSVSCGVTVRDGSGSGIDGRAIEYCISAWGDGEEHFINWTLVNNNMQKDVINILLEIQFERGSDNFIKWRARDRVGNGFAVSEPQRIWIDTPPVPVISLPDDGDSFTIGEDIELNATGSFDDDGDELSYFWSIKEKTSKKKVIGISGKGALISLDKTGTYVVELFVNDGLGFNESVDIDIRIGDKDGPVIEDDDDDIETKDDTKENKSLLSEWGWLLMIIGIVVLLVVIMLFLILKRKKSAEEEAPHTPTPPIQQPHMYSQGYMGMTANGYNTSGPGYEPRQYGATGQAYQGSSAYYGGGYSQAPLALPQGPRTDYPAASYQPPTPSYLPGETAPAAGYQAPGTGAEMQYSLPSFATDQGVQSLDLLALPAASEDELQGEIGEMPSVSPGADTQQPVGMDHDPGSAASPDATAGGPAAAVDPLAAMPPAAPPMAPDMFPQATGVTPEPTEAQPPAPIGIETPGPETQAADIAGLPPLPDLAAPEAPAPTAGGTVVQCHSCGSQYEVTTDERPTIIECPTCHEQGYLTE